jgi:hypothetical protein
MSAEISKVTSEEIDQVSRWKEIIDETNPAGLLELEELEIFLGGQMSSSGCSNTSTSCCSCNVSSSCC